MPNKVVITQPVANIVKVTTSNNTVNITENKLSLSVSTSASSGSQFELGADLTVTNTIGDAIAGSTTYSAGTNLEDIIKDILSPYFEPAFTSVSWSASGAQQADGESLLVECGLAASVSSLSITWSYPENLDDNTNLTITDVDVQPNVTIANADIADYGALSVPHVQSATYAIPVTAGYFTRDIVISTAYLGNDGTGSAVALSKTVHIHHRHRMLVVASTSSTVSSIETLISNGDTVLSTLGLSPDSSEQIISVSCNANTVDTSKYTWLLVPRTSAEDFQLAEVYAEIGGASVVDYTESFQEYDNGGSFFTRTVGTASPTYRAYRSNQTGAFDTDVVLKLTITH